jgi:N-acetyl-anhydromuramyl-L-alanine amidase AmpD
MKLHSLAPDWLAHRARPTMPTLIVLHATAGGTARSSIAYLRAQKLSYHYILARDGKDSASSAAADGSEPVIFRCAPDAAQAFHCSSLIPPPLGDGTIAKNSIGISLANNQRVANPEPYPAPQLAALDELIEQLTAELPTLLYLSTHAAVQPWNRIDPFGLDAKAIASRHGLRWWEPTQEQARAYAPRIR